MSQSIAVADLGGTHARFAIAEVNRGRVIRLGEPVTLNTADYSGFEDAWRAFGKAIGGEPSGAIAIAFAGPVDGDELKLTNSEWVLRPALLPAKLGIDHVRMINDFGAVGHAVAGLGREYFSHVCGPQEAFPGRGVVSVVGPGTGLGVAQLWKADGAYQVIETEGGHIDFAPLDEVEDEILAYLRQHFGRVSVERLISGAGLVNFYNALAAIERRPAEDFDGRSIWAAALEGSDPLARETLDRFLLTLGSVAGDLALAHGASAVAIAGGLGYRLRDHLAGSGFADRFIAKGRFERRMKLIPVKLVTHPQPGLFGAASAFAREQG